MSILTVVDQIDPVPVHHVQCLLVSLGPLTNGDRDVRGPVGELDAAVPRKAARKVKDSAPDLGVIDDLDWRPVHVLWHHFLRVRHPPRPLHRDGRFGAVVVSTAKPRKLQRQLADLLIRHQLAADEVDWGGLRLVDLLVHLRLPLCLLLVLETRLG